MRKPREIGLESKATDATAEKTRQMLRDLASKRMRETSNEIDDDSPIEDDDDEFIQAPLKERERPRGGPLSNKMKMDRIKASEERNRARGLDPDSLVRRNFDPDSPVDKDLPQAARQVISNRTAARPGGPGPVDSPNITEVQRLERRLEEQSKQIKELQKNGGAPTINTEEKPVSRLAARRKNYDSNYEVIKPPSQCFFYNFAPEDLQVRKIDVATQIAITNARRYRDMSAYIDAVGSTFKDIDIRDLSHPDWFYILYWHKFHSYPKSSLILDWTSKYGNNNKYRIQETDLKFVYPSISRQEFLERYDSKGLCIPTLRDWELLNTPNDLTEEDRQIYFRAQYFKGDTLEDKVDNYFSTGVDVERLELINELQIDTHHGVINTVDVIDEKFDAVKYLVQRNEHLANIRAEAQRYKDNPVYFNAISEEADDIEQEINEKNETLKNGGQVRAEVETQPVRFDALDIFPIL